jgi:nitroreductase
MNTFPAFPGGAAGLERDNAYTAGQRSALAMLLGRRSRWPLSEPGPGQREIHAICDAGLRAPDNGLLRPWRFVIIQGDARAGLGRVLHDLSRSRCPTHSDHIHQQYAQRAFAAPLLIALGAHIDIASPIPQLEQILSVGAAAMNMLNAVHALGYGGYWTSGLDCIEPELLDAMGLADCDRLLGFLYVGTPQGDMPEGDRPAYENHVCEWRGPA